MAELVLTAPHGACLLCGNTPISEDEKREVLPMVVAVGMDVNWGESVQICLDCVGVMADMNGRVTQEKYSKLIKAFDELQHKHLDLQTRFAGTTERLKKILDGKRAEAKQKKVAA